MRHIFYSALATVCFTGVAVGCLAKGWWIAAGFAGLATISNLMVIRIWTKGGGRSVK